MAPATPTGLMVSEITETSITWTWDASEGALGYAVQVSLDEMFDDMDQIGLTQETSFTATPIPPRTSVFLRVRAGTGTPEALAAALATGSLEGLVLSAWTTHVTGMSDMPVPEPEPEPEPPDPVSVMFMIPDGEHPMMPDGRDDEETAMASVNNDIVVTTNSLAVIVPLNFNEDASPVKMHPGENNMPFKFVSWMAMQSQVVNDGVTFKVLRVFVNAAQEIEPTGDTAYVTCGPFDCMEGMDAPAIGLENSTACNAWDPTFELQAGMVDNIPTPEDATGDPETGIDLGWMYTSNAGFRATHDIAVTSAKSAAVKASSTMTALAVPDVGSGILGSRVDGTDPADGDFGDAEDTADSCETTYTKTIGTVQKPGGDQCFRVALNKNNDFLSNYSVSLAPSGTSVSWGEIAWDAFDELDCPSMDYAASDMVDVCELFADEAGRLAKAAVAPMFVGGTTGNDSKLSGFDVTFGTAKSQHFKSLWYMQSTKTGASKGCG